MSQSIKLPFYHKLMLIIIGIYVLVAMLFVAQSIVVPILFSTIFGILLSPLVHYLTKLKINRVLAIFIVLIFTIGILALGLVLLAKQMMLFANSSALILNKVYDLIDETISWVSNKFDISHENIKVMIDEAKQEFMIKSKTIIAPTLLNIKDILFVMMVLPVYVFMIMYYQPLLLEFIRKLFGVENKITVNKIIYSTKFIIQRYLLALLLEAGIMSILNTIGLFVLGIPYAILLGIIGAVLNIVPYLGGLIAMLLYVIVALITKDESIYMLYVVLLYTAIQLIDNNLIMPKLVGARVKINALVAIIAVVLGGTLWGVPGMFISLPLVAIAKLICDQIESLKPWGYLLGDTMPTIQLFKKQ